MKPILDVCCGPRGMWFDKSNPLALYIDNRRENWVCEYPSGTKKANIAPDIVEDFTCLPFPDCSFYLVVMDPPHICQTSNKGMIVRQYGMLPENWKDTLSRGFEECFRVLRMNGVLIFKWNECRIPIKDILCLTNKKPLFGHHSGKAMKTHWLTFMKTTDTISQDDGK